MQCIKSLYLVIVIAFGLSGCALQDEIPATQPPVAEVPAATRTMAPISDAVPTIVFHVPEAAELEPTATATVPAGPEVVEFNPPTSTTIVAELSPAATVVEATKTLEPTLIATEAAPDEISVGSTCVIFESTVVYDSPGGGEVGTVDAGKFSIIGEEDGFWHIRHERGAEGWIGESQDTYGLEGAAPPEGEGPTQEVVRDFPERLSFGGGRLEVINLGSRYGIKVTDQVGKPDGTIAVGQEGIDLTTDYINWVLGNYPDAGDLRIYFGDAVGQSEFFGLGQDFGFYCLYSREVDGVREDYIMVTEAYRGDNFQWTNIVFCINNRVAMRLDGDVTSGKLPDDIVGMLFPGRLRVNR